MDISHGFINGYDAIVTLCTNLTWILHFLLICKYQTLTRFLFFTHFEYWLCEHYPNMEKTDCYFSNSLIQSVHFSGWQVWSRPSLFITRLTLIYSYLNFGLFITWSLFLIICLKHRGQKEVVVQFVIISWVKLCESHSQELLR